MIIEWIIFWIIFSLFFVYLIMFVISMVRKYKRINSMFVAVDKESH